MLDVLNRVVEWLDAGRDVALATVVEVIRKAPREAGTTMAVNDRGEVAGSVSGGCVEPAVIEVAQEVLATGRPRLVTFGISDDDAFEVGLSCGGTIRVWVEPARGPWPAVARRLAEALAAGQAVALARVLKAEDGDPGPATAGAPAQATAAAATRAPAAPAPAAPSQAPAPAPPEEPAPAAAPARPAAGGVLLLREGDAGAPAWIVAGSSGDDLLDRELERRAAQVLVRDEPVLEHLGAEPGDSRSAAAAAAGASVPVFIQPFAPPPVLYIIGAVHPAGALAEAGRFLGYRVVVCDPRSPFATPERIPAAHAIVRQWPDEYLATARLTPRDAVCVLTHDLKFDVPALLAALNSPVGYIGVMGSRRTHQRRLAALREAGVGDDGLQRLHAPIGLDIGARTPEEMAVAIMAQIIACRRTNRPEPAPGQAAEMPA